MIFYKSTKGRANLSLNSAFRMFRFSLGFFFFLLIDIILSFFFQVFAVNDEHFVKILSSLA